MKLAAQVQVQAGANILWLDHVQNKIHLNLHPEGSNTLVTKQFKI